jgi:hypothetical protein
MTQLTMMASVKKYVKEYAGAVVAVGLIYGGILRFVAFLSRRLADGFVRLINAIIQTGFRDRMPLRDVYSGGPRWVEAPFVASGIIAITLGILVGLWVNSKSQREPTS